MGQSADCFRPCSSWLCSCLQPPEPSSSRVSNRRSVYNRLRMLLREGKRASSLELSVLLLNFNSQRKFNRLYTLGDRLGGGSFGSVHKCTSKLSGEERAVKLLPKSQVKADMTAVVNEIEIMIRLDHPNIVKFYEFFEDARALLLLQELCEKGDLSSIRGLDACKDLVRLLYRDVMLGLAYCHNLGVAHRDLKFENCVLSKGPYRDIAKIIDFGLAAIRREEQEGDEWLQDALGTMYFVAPEVITKSLRYGVKCDCWSFGVMVYMQLTSGEHPFARIARKMDQERLFECIRSQQLRQEPLERESVDPHARELVLRLLVRDVAARASAQEALLSEWLQPACLEDVMYSPKQLTRKESRRLMKRLTTWNAVSEFDKVVLMMSSHLTNPHVLSRTSSMFMSMDRSQDGFLDQAEVESGLASCGLEVDSETLGDTYRALDTSSDGKVSHTEWVSATIDRQNVESAKAITELFSFFDHDCSGYVSLEEIRRVVGDKEAAEVLKSADTSKDALLDFQEFTDLVKQVARRRFGSEELDSEPSISSPHVRHLIP